MPGQGSKKAFPSPGGGGGRKTGKKKSPKLVSFPPEPAERVFDAGQLMPAQLLVGWVGQPPPKQFIGH